MSDTVLRLSDVAFNYPGTETDVISALNFVARRGQVVAITGRSGRGKSTLLYIMGLLLSPSSGSVAILGTETNAMNDTERSRVRGEHVGFIFQDGLLDPRRTAMENVLEGLRYSPKRDALGADGPARRLMRRVGLEPSLADRLPGAVSGGQAQRIALCRALVKQPAVVLGDEPTGNLDSGTAEVVLGSLRKAADDGAAVLVATHDREVRNWADDRLHLGNPSDAR